jgi:hypothetical protein
MSAARPLRPRHALAEALGVAEQPRIDTNATAGVREACALLRCSLRTLRQRRADGRLPRPITRRPLLWRTADLLAMREE